MSAPIPFSQIAARIVASGRITRADENYLLHTNLSGSALTLEELDQVRNLIERLQMGLLRVEN